ncbi:MAG: LytTR family transcriptional regulator DNA-binding domain-containing protein [Bacteroidales bacterium]
MKTQFGLSFGLLLILLAIILVLSSFGIIPAPISEIVISWQTLILVIGVKMLLMRMFLPGAVVAVVGLYFEIPLVCDRLGLVFPYDNSSFLALFVALMLVLAGVFSIQMQRKVSSKDKGVMNIKPGSKGLVNISCAFGENNHTILDRPFKGARLSVAFGTVNLNLEKSELNEGDAYLEVNNAFGEIRLLVPDNWIVESAVQSIFGEFKDRRQAKISSGTRRLIINGACFFGEIYLDSVPTANEHTYSEIEQEESEEVTEERIETISVKQNNQVHIISLDELFYIQADGDYVTLCTAKGNFLKEQTMKYFQRVLPSERFVRIHRSYIVNIAQISSIDSQGKETYYVVLKNGTSLRVSVSGYQELKQKLDI